MLGTNVGALGCVDVFMCIPGMTSLIHDRVRLTSRDKKAVSVTDSSFFGTTLGSILSFFLRTFLCWVMLFLFRFRSRFILLLGSSSSPSSGSLLVFAIEDALDARGGSLACLCFFPAGDGDGAGSFASLLSSRDKVRYICAYVRYILRYICTYRHIVIYMYIYNCNFKLFIIAINNCNYRIKQLQ